MINYSLTNIHEKLSGNSDINILYGAGDIGELTKFALDKLKINVNYFCDSNKDKTGTKYFSQVIKYTILGLTCRITFRLAVNTLV